MEKNPMICSVQEHRINVNGQELILKVSNLPFMPTLNKLAEIMEEAQKLSYESQLARIHSTDDLEDELSELENKIISAKASEDMPKSEYRRVLKLVQEQEALEKRIQSLQASSLASGLLPVTQFVAKELLTLLCPMSNVTDDIANAVGFNDIIEIAEKSYKVNKLDLIPKKLIPQSLKDQMANLISGAV